MCVNDLTSFRLFHPLMESVVRELLELINDYAVIITKRERKTEETRRHMGLKWEEFVRVEEEEVR